MTIKRFTVLANSVKHHPGRCIAGIELDAASSQPRLGEWVRPVGSTGEGELYPPQTIFASGIQPAIFDLVEIECQQSCDDSSQPENWLVRDGHKWKKIGSLNNKILPALVEMPKGLWDQPNVKSDRTTREFIAAHPPQQSLYLINIPNSILTREGHRHRLSFTFGGKHYNLSVTDPNAENIDKGKSNVELTNKFACISLAPAFPNKYDGQHYHYKLIATLFA